MRFFSTAKPPVNWRNGPIGPDDLRNRSELFSWALVVWGPTGLCRDMVDPSSVDLTELETKSTIRDLRHKYQSFLTEPLISVLFLSPVLFCLLPSHNFFFFFKSIYNRKKRKKKVFMGGFVISLSWKWR